MYHGIMHAEGMYGQPPEARPRRTQAERSEATRAALIAAARRLFAMRGYARCGREEIVADAGVTRGALQHHFGDKQSLFRAVYEVVEQEVVEATARAAMDVGDDPVEQLRAGCHAYLDKVMEPDVQRICAIDGPAVLPSDIRQEIIDRYALGLVREAVQHAQERGRIDAAPVEVLTRMLLASVMAGAQYVATAPDPEAARADAGQTVDLFLDSLER